MKTFAKLSDLMSLQENIVFSPESKLLRMKSFINGKAFLNAMEKQKKTV